MSVFEKNPRLTLAAFWFLLVVMAGGLAEITLRFIVPYDIGYYTAVKKPGIYEYPYGTIHINQDGYPDTEFDRSSPKKKIGYFGDSVTFGVGAGEEYRFSNLLEQKYPAFEHWTFSMIANGIEDDLIVRTAQEYGLSRVIYALNLNDIMPVTAPDNTPQTPSNPETPILRVVQQWIWDHLDATLRGHSYLYTSVRTLLKNALLKIGYSHTGFVAAELFPEQNRALVLETADRITRIGNTLNKQGIQFCVLILPYEMQISRDAAHTYRDLGIDWEDGFETGSTQKILKQGLKGIALYDGMNAFSDVTDTAQTGEFFVYNKGDKIDFNHPNRAGHARLTAGMIASHFCGF